MIIIIDKKTGKVKGELKMKCGTFQKLKQFARHNPDKLEHITEPELEQWLCRYKEVAEDVVNDNGSPYRMLDGILCI